MSFTVRPVPGFDAERLVGTLVVEDNGSPVWEHRGNWGDRKFLYRSALDLAGVMGWARERAEGVLLAWLNEISVGRRESPPRLDALRVQIFKQGTLSLDLKIFPNGFEFGPPNHLADRFYVGLREVRSRTCDCALHPHPQPHWHACAPYHARILEREYGATAAWQEAHR